MRTLLFLCCIFLSCTSNDAPSRTTPASDKDSSSVVFGDLDFNPLDQFNSLDSIRDLGRRRLDSLAIVEKAKIKSLPRKTDWSVRSSLDEMTGERSSYCSSKSTSATREMAFPYDDVSGSIVIGCDGQDEWAYVHFTEEPNLLGTIIGDGYHSIPTRIKFDDSIERVYMTQTWGSKAIHFNDDYNIIRKIMKARTILLELEWYGNGKTYFEFSGTGSTGSINEMRQSCR